VIEYLLKQIEFFSAADRSPAIVHPQLGVYVLGVGTHGAQDTMHSRAISGPFKSVLSSLSTSSSRSLSGSIMSDF